VRILSSCVADCVGCSPHLLIYCSLLPALCARSITVQFPVHKQGCRVRACSTGGWVKFRVAAGVEGLEGGRVLYSTRYRQPSLQLPLSFVSIFHLFACFVHTPPLAPAIPIRPIRAVGWYLCPCDIGRPAHAPNQAAQRRQTGGLAHRRLLGLGPGARWRIIHNSFSRAESSREQRHCGAI
jgi:hypothetical protein